VPASWQALVMVHNFLIAINEKERKMNNREFTSFGPLSGGVAKFYVQTGG
jgi:hypothetical protein